MSSGILIMCGSQFDLHLHYVDHSHVAWRKKTKIIIYEERNNNNRRIRLTENWFYFIFVHIFSVFSCKFCVLHIKYYFGLVSNWNCFINIIWANKEISAEKKKINKNDFVTLFFIYKYIYSLFAILIRCV